MGKKRPASPVCSGTDTKKKKKKKESDPSKKERHKHKKHSHTTTKKHTSTVDSKTSHHKTITLDNIPDSLLPHRSLINFVDDRTKLLDEVFSIFSEEEISNMLPDILKGIKLDEVQKLCYEQLKVMEVTAITDIIQSSSGETSSKANDISSNEDDVKVTACDQHQAPHHSPKQKESTELSKVAEVDVPVKKSPVVPNDDDTSDVDTVNDKQSTTDDQNLDTKVSTADKSVNVLEYSGINEDSIELLPATMGDDIDRELTFCPLSSAREDNNKQTTEIVETHSVESHSVESHSVESHSVETHSVETHSVETHSVETPTASITNSSVSETAILAELNMRKRALQSQLKKQQLEKKVNEQRTKEELLLRQKALQSLLAANATKRQ